MIRSTSTPMSTPPGASATSASPPEWERLKASRPGSTASRGLPFSSAASAGGSGSPSASARIRPSAARAAARPPSGPSSIRQTWTSSSVGDGGAVGMEGAFRRPRVGILAGGPFGNVRALNLEALAARAAALGADRRLRIVIAVIGFVAVTIATALIAHPADVHRVRELRRRGLHAHGAEGASSTTANSTTASSPSTGPSTTSSGAGSSQLFGLSVNHDNGPHRDRWSSGSSRASSSASRCGG